MYGISRIPGSYKRHYHVEVQLVTESGRLRGAGAAVRHVLFQTQLADHFKEGWQKFLGSGPTSRSELVVVSDLMQLANDRRLSAESLIICAQQSSRSS